MQTLYWIWVRKGYLLVVVADEGHEPEDDFGLEGLGGARLALHQHLQQNDRLEEDGAHLFLD